MPRKAVRGSIAITSAVAVSVMLGGASPASAAEMHFKFVAQHSAKCMDVAGGSTAHTANVHQWQCIPGVNSQRWYIRKLDDGAWLIVNKNSGKCLDVAWAGTHAGANVIQATCSYANNQRWWIPNGQGYTKIVAKHSGMCLDVAWADGSDGADIVQSSCWDGLNQLWFVDGWI